ncbi:hypothetical protein KEM55_005276 [Ascosphaera atra]|nr:hypothetical protein KEM55_005276 [Ascosphaera atra]
MSASESRGQLLPKWKEMGILKQDFQVDGIYNLLSLCSVCHEIFDAEYPLLLLLPRDLEYFIRHEKADYEDRVVKAAQGISQRRSTPPEDDMVCDAYIYSKDRIARGFPKPLPASAVAFILKALKGCFTPYGGEWGVSQEVRHALVELVSHWERPDPKVEGSDLEVGSPKPETASKRTKTTHDHALTPSRSQLTDAESESFGEEDILFGPAMTTEDNASAVRKVMKAYGRLPEE